MDGCLIFLTASDGADSNEQIHLRLRHESVSALCLLYYLPYKIVLTFVNIASCYYSIYKYAKYFAKRHPKVIEDEKAVAVVLRLEEESYSDTKTTADIAGQDSTGGLARRVTVTAVGTNLSSIAQDIQQDLGAAEINIVDFAAQHASDPEDGRPREDPLSMSNLGRRPPPDPLPRRPYSWQQVTSNTSSNADVSPFDERRKSQFPLPSPEILMDEEPTDGKDQLPDRRASSSLWRRSLPTSWLRRSPSDRRPRVRRPSSAPRASSPTHPEVILRHSPSVDSEMTFHIPTPTLERPEPAILNSNGQFVVVSSAEDVGGGWPLRRTQPNSNRYISVLAATDNVYDGASRSRDRLFIYEEDDELTLRDQEVFEVRSSMQTDCSSRKSRLIIKGVENV